jgi:hypothetical protein
MTPATLGVPPSRPAWVSPVLPWEFCSPERQEDLREAWTYGEISHQLTPSQCSTYDKLRTWEDRLYAERGREFVLDSSRRWGKSELGCVWLIENALRKPHQRLLYIGPERKQIVDLTLPIMARILSECPPELAPRYHASKRLYEFPNGSRIELYGLDKNPNASRGGAIDGAFLDECGFFKRLKYLLKSVLKPQMLGRIWACLLLASTPPDTPAHPWSEEIVPAAIARGAHDIKTIEEADQYPLEEIEAFIAEAGGREDPDCQREYFARHVADAARIVVPEYAAVASRIVKAVLPPAHRDCYTIMDPGWHDLLAVLFGYWHFEEAKLVIEDELAEVKMNSGKLAALLKAKETGLWGELRCVSSKGELREQPYRRYTDRDPRLVSDLRVEHGLRFSVAKKDTPEQAVNQLRVAIAQERIWIHPRCVKLQAHLKGAIWKNELHKAFSWQGGPFGHFDLVAALLYMWRNVKRNRNPAPQQTVVLTTDQHQAVQREREAASRWASERQPSQWSKAAPKPRAQWTREGGRFVRTR